MDEFPFDTTYYYKGEEREMAVEYFDIPELFKTDSEDSYSSKESNEKYRFLVDYYLIDKLFEFIKQPPDGSYLGIEWKASESGTEYASLKYLHKSTLKSHRDYTNKLDKVYYSKKFRDSCQENFEKEFKKYNTKMKRRK